MGCIMHMSYLSPETLLTRPDDIFFVAREKLRPSCCFFTFLSYLGDLLPAFHRLISCACTTAASSSTCIPVYGYERWLKVQQDRALPGTRGIYARYEILGNFCGPNSTAHKPFIYALRNTTQATRRTTLGENRSYRCRYFHGGRMARQWRWIATCLVLTTTLPASRLRMQA